jgi:hypothetical protein
MSNFLGLGFFLKVAKKFDLNCVFVIFITFFSTISMSSLTKSEEIRNQPTIDNVIRNNTEIELSNEDIDEIITKAIEITDSIYPSYITASVSKNETIFESVAGFTPVSGAIGVFALPSYPINTAEESRILIKKNFASNIPGPSRTYHCNYYIDLLTKKKISNKSISQIEQKCPYSICSQKSQLFFANVVEVIETLQKAKNK